MKPEPGWSKRRGFQYEEILKGSNWVSRQGELRIQDSYSLRCIPQVHGASRMAIEYALKVVESELNAATDNPLVFADSAE